MIESGFPNKINILKDNIHRQVINDVLNIHDSTVPCFSKNMAGSYINCCLKNALELIFEGCLIFFFQIQKYTFIQKQSCAFVLWKICQVSLRLNQVIIEDLETRLVWQQKNMRLKNDGTHKNNEKLLAPQ